MDITPDKQTSRDLSPQLVTILTTEHYNLQNGRASTIADASGRANLFISAVSTSLVALAFIGQASNFGKAFSLFSLILFPALWFLGLMTFERTLQSTIEDVLYARGMSRIRHLFLEHAPDMQPYFILSSSDDATATLQKIGMKDTYWQILLSTPGTIAVINGIIGAVFVGFLLDALFMAPLLILLSCGIIFFLLSVAFSLWSHRNKFYQALESQPPLFTGSSESPKPTLPAI
ncbi:hypothetical protein EPA93_01340 [Ktedonosporobacter rubrisoli]|uniref:Uncharacterized protein n=1 Tax=Ktedonosporobacter rubrisoli TaxID=2509675 RepID=A0A4P6JI28_KTERU|nr:hypothetical protein [Ktedonosporobacter rubrisoli]QBD74704.1 hypothetical protein EPA93_01340 [Ktedonosporobacter rubrisoli]